MTTEQEVWLLVVTVILLLAWAGFNRRAKAQKANQEFKQLTSVDASSITTIEHLQPLSVEAICQYSSGLSYRLKSWICLYLSANITYFAVLYLPFGEWHLILVVVPGMIMVISGVAGFKDIMRQYLLDRSGRIDSGGNIRPPIRPTG